MELRCALHVRMDMRMWWTFSSKIQRLKRTKVSESIKEGDKIECELGSEFGAPLHIAILLDKKNIVEALVKDKAEEADDRCERCLVSLENQSLDTLIGMNMDLKAVDIADLMDQNKDQKGILDILREKGLKEVRCGGIIWWNMG